MKRMPCIFLFIFCLLATAYARDPVFQSDKMPNGIVLIRTATVEDALILLNGDYNLPNKYWLITPFTGMTYLQFDKAYLIGIRMLTESEKYGYPMGLVITSDQQLDYEKIVEYSNIHQCYIYLSVEIIYSPRLGKNLALAKLLCFFDSDLKEIQF